MKYLNICSSVSALVEQMLERKVDFLSLQAAFQITEVLFQ